MAKKKEQYHFFVYDRIFGQPFELFINYTQQELYEVVTKKYHLSEKFENHPDWQAQCFQLDAEGHPTINIIGVHSWSSERDLEKVIINELAHCLIKMWVNHNIPISWDSQEFFAQSMGTLYADIMSELDKLRKKKHGRKQHKPR